jgi:hypothetical protein
MASRFWVGGTGNWDASTTTHWSATSGGAGGASVPTSSDTVTFNSSSNATAYTVTVTATANCSDLTIGNPASGAITFAGSSALNIYGSLSIASGITRTFTGAIAFLATTTGKTITTNAVGLASAASFGGVGGEWTLQDAWTNTSTFAVTAGTFVANNFNVTNGSATSTGSSTRTMTLGSGMWTMTSASAFTLSGSNLTFNCNTSTIKFTDTSNTAITFAGLSKTFYNIWFARGGSTASLTISGSNTFNDFEDTGTAAHSILFTGGTTQTVTTFTVSGSTGNLVTINSTTTGTHTLTKSGGGTITCTYVNVQHSIATPANTWYATTGSVSNQSTTTVGSGWIFPRFWVGGTGDWDNSTTTHWSSASGGAGGESVPIFDSPVVFDSASNATSYTVTVTATTPSCGNLNVGNPASGSITFSGSNQLTLTGSPYLASGVIFTYTGTLYLNSNVAATITTNGTSLNSIVALGGTGPYVLQDSLITSKTLSVGIGTFDANNFDVTMADLSAASTSTRSLVMGSGLWTLNSGNWETHGLGLTINAGTSTIRMADSSNNPLTFRGGSKTYHNLWIDRGPSTTSTGIEDSNTFNNLSCTVDPTGANGIYFIVGSTQTLKSFTVSGLPGLKVTLTSSTSGTFGLSKSGGGIVSCDYLIISHSVATPANTWYAGANSTNNQAVATAGSGWIFTVPPFRAASSMLAVFE